VDGSLCRCLPRPAPPSGNNRPHARAGTTAQPERNNRPRPEREHRPRPEREHRHMPERDQTGPGPEREKPSHSRAEQPSQAERNNRPMPERNNRPRPERNNRPAGRAVTTVSGPIGSNQPFTTGPVPAHSSCVPHGYHDRAAAVWSGLGFAGVVSPSSRRRRASRATPMSIVVTPSCEPHQRRRRAGRSSRPMDGPRFGVVPTSPVPIVPSHASAHHRH